MPGVKKYNLVNVQIFDGYKFAFGHVIINGPVIGDNKDTPGTEPINCNGGYLLPGFTDCHVHLWPDHPECMYKMRDFGITSAMDMETWPIDKFNELRSLPGVPFVKGAGLAAQYNRPPPDTWPPQSEVETPADADMFVAQRASEGLNFIKMIADPPNPPPIPPPRGLDLPTMTALCDCANDHDMLTIAHAVEPKGFHLALDAGVKIITHTPLAKGIDGGEGEASGIAKMAALKRICVPTLIMMKLTAPFVDPDGKLGLSVENAIDSVKQMHALGVPILAGTDCNPGNGPVAPEYGSSLHEEMELLTQANMSNVEVLRSATVLPPQYFRMPDRGVIAPGYTSDLVLLTADPTVDIKNTRKIAKIWVRGEMFASGDR